MNDALPDLNLMLVFEALLRERSVTRAARALGLGQPSTSNALARLRALLKDELFIRAGATMQPTARALALSEPITAALALLRGAVAGGAAFDPATTTRRFRLSAGDYAAMLLLPPLVRRLRAAAPGIDLRCRFAEKDTLPRLLDDGTLDLAIGVFPAAPMRLAVRPLLREEFLCLLRARHPAAARPLTPETYAALPHVLVTERADDTGAVDEALRRRGLRRRVAVTVPHVSLVPDLLAETDFIATVAVRVARAFAANGGLVTRKVPVAMPPWQLTALTARHASGDAGLAWLLDELAACAAAV